MYKINYELRIMNYELSNKMKKILYYFVVIFTISSISFAQSVEEKKIAELKPYVEQFMNYLSKEDFSKIPPMLDSMAAAQFKNKFELISTQLTFQYGKFHSIDEYKYRQYQNYDMLEITCDYDRAVLGYRFVFDSLRKIAGFVIISKEDKDFYKNPEYVDTASFTERKFEFGVEGWRLPCVLSIPKGEGPFPVVVLVHGSGPNDRDETLGPNKPFRDIAWGLASRKIAVFRYDKRTLTHRNEFQQMTDSITPFLETIEDAIKAVDTLKYIPEIDKNKIFVLGHSLGGMLLPRIAKGDTAIKGLIIMAGSSRPLEDIYYSQVKYILNLDSVISKEENEELKKIEKQVKAVKSKKLSIKTPASDLPMNINALYWLDLRNYKPYELAKKLNKPMLILQGHRDYQVTYDDFKLWQKALINRKDVELKSYPKLNHLFMEGEGMSNPNEYNKEGHVSELVIKAISGWIHK